MTKIMYVDDDPDDLHLFVEVLQEISTDVQCITAIDGANALEKLAATDLPKCIYIDINLPGMTGLELLRTLKNHSTYKTIPAFILSTSISPDDDTEAKNLGAVACLRKPSDFQGMKKLLGACLILHGVVLKED